MNAFWMFYAMSRRFIFSKESVLSARSLHISSTAHSQLFDSASILSRQIKAAINLLLPELLRGVLERLEEESRKTKNKTSWALIFSANSILCVLVGQLEVAIDAQAVLNIMEGQDPDDAHKHAIKACEDIQDLLIYYSWPLFHGIQGSHNPIKNGYAIDGDSDHNKGVAQLINEIRELLEECGNSSFSLTAQRLTCTR